MLRVDSPRSLRRILNLWPPFLFAGIRVMEVGEGWRSARVRLRMHAWNRTVIGTHFGGSLFAMCDPFWMLLVMHALGPDYIVWDKAGEIEFVKPGKCTVEVLFRLDDAVLDELRAATANGEKALRWFENTVTDAEGEIVARVRKQLYVRRKAGR